MRRISSCFALVAVVSAFPSIADSRNVTKNLALKGEIFAEIYARPERLKQIEKEVLTRGWRLDCTAAATAERFIRVQLPSTAALDPDIRYFVDLRDVSKVQMIYETMAKEPCTAEAVPARFNAADHPIPVARP